MRKLISILSVILILTCFITPILVSSHSGRTDENGGHYDNINGGYHYHHGYPAHQHNNGCPYNYKDSAEHNYQTEGKKFGEILLTIIKIILLTLEILLFGLLGWIFVYINLLLFLLWFCEKILGVVANESVVSKITIVIIIVISTIIASIIVLNS